MAGVQVQLAAARARVDTWPREIVRPLRAVRKRLKTGPAPAPDENASGSTSATVIWMEARASGQRAVSGAPAGYNAAWFFQSVTLKAGLHYAQDGQWRKDPTARVVENAIPIPAPQFTVGPPTLRSPSETRLSRIDSGLFTSTVVNYMKSTAARVNFTTWLGFERAIRADVPASSWDRLWKPEGGGGIIDRIKAHVDAGTIRI